MIPVIHSISYDLHRPGQDYPELIDAIKACPQWAKINDSHWIVRTSDSDSTIFTNLQKCIDANDQIFVCTIMSGERYRAGANLSNAALNLLF